MTRGKNFPAAASAYDPDASLASERVRVAHELHDGVIQTLVGISLRLSALQRHAPDPESLKAHLEETQELLRRGISDLRELVVRIKPVSVDAERLPAVITETVERFGRDTGIRARCTCHGPPPRISPQASGQIVRIVQEALMNVRRHSGAANVLVSLASEIGRIRIAVDDDGHGFPFEGRWDHDALDAARRGPVVIKERVRLLAGAVTIDSAPGRGARLEIEIPYVDAR